MRLQPVGALGVAHVPGQAGAAEYIAAVLQGIRPAADAIATPPSTIAIHAVAFSYTATP